MPIAPLRKSGKRSKVRAYGASSGNGGNMKRFLIFGILLATIVFVFAGCGSKTVPQIEQLGKQQAAQAKAAKAQWDYCKTLLKNPDAKKPGTTIYRELNDALTKALLDAPPYVGGVFGRYNILMIDNNITPEMIKQVDQAFDKDLNN